VHALALIGLALAAVNLLLLAVLLGRRPWVNRTDRRRQAAVERIRPAVLAFIDGDAGAGDDLEGAEAEAFGALLGRYARSLRGEARERITGWFEEHGAVDRELGRLRDRRAWRRAEAAFVLGDMGSKAAVPGLVTALQDGSRDVRAAATRSLGRLQAGEAIVPAIEAAIERRVPRSVVTAAAIELGPSVVPHLVPLFGHERPAVRSAAAELHGLLDVSGNAQPLIQALRDPSPEVRTAAALALERVADDSATQALLETLADDDASVRAAAAAALGTIGGDETVDALLQVAQRDAFEPARAAAHAAARIDPARVRTAADVAAAGPFLAEAADLAAL
jgi:hypothetical protein